MLIACFTSQVGADLKMSVYGPRTLAKQMTLASCMQLGASIPIDQCRLCQCSLLLVSDYIADQKGHKDYKIHVLPSCMLQLECEVTDYAKPNYEIKGVRLSALK